MCKAPFIIFVVTEVSWEQKLLLVLYVLSKLIFILVTQYNKNVCSGILQV